MAARLKVLCGGAMRVLMVEVVPLFECLHAAKVDIEFRLTSVLQKEIETGATFDVAGGEAAARSRTRDRVQDGARRPRKIRPGLDLPGSPIPVCRSQRAGGRCL